MLPAAAAATLGAPAGRAADPSSRPAPVPQPVEPIGVEVPPAAWPDRPALEWRQPGGQAREVSRFAAVRVRFDRAVRGVSESTVGLWEAIDGTPIASDVAYDPLGFAVTIRPLAPLPPGRRVEVRLTDGIRELSGGRLASQRWSFAVTRDVTAPAILRASPAPWSEGVPWETRVTVSFSEPVRGVSAATLTLFDERTDRPVPGTVSYDPTAALAVFAPEAPLWAARRYRVVVGPGISDRVANQLERRSWTFSTRPLASVRPRPVAEIPDAVPIGIWHVPARELDEVAPLGVDFVIRKFAPPDDVVRYLDEARRFGVKVIVGFSHVYRDGVVRPELIGPLVAPIRRHPALYGYLAVTEPSVQGVSLSEMRQLYTAFKAADPEHPVLVSIGMIGEFGGPTNQWGPGAADIVLAEWYPTVFASRIFPDGWRTNTPYVLSHFRDVVERATPGLPIWLVTQGYTYRPADLRSPTEAELADQVRDAFRYLGASGVAFYPWKGGEPYEDDVRRNAALQETLRQVVNAVRTRTLFA